MQKINFKDLSQKFFLIGLFLLPTVVPFSALFLLSSLIINFFHNSRKIICDKFNYPFIIASILLLIVSIFHTLNYENIVINFNDEQLIWEPISSWIGLINWIPLFFFFMGVQENLSSPEKRIIASKMLIFGSIPILIMGFGQYFFGWEGPFQSANKLIVWFMKPRNDGEGMSGIFSNQNYAGCWLNIILPFSIALFHEKSNNILKKGFILPIILAISTSIFLSSSRNSWGGLLLTIPLILGPIYTLPIIIFILIIFILVNLQSLNLIPENLKNFGSIIPDNLNVISQFMPSSYHNEATHRMFMFKFASGMIGENFLFGLGATSFTLYYLKNHNIYMSHPHNLFLELAFNYGLLPAIITFASIIFYLIYSLKIIFFSEYFKSKNFFLYEKAWATSFFVLFCSQIVDIQYFDGRISIVFWLLLAGLKEIIIEGRNIKTIV